MGPWVEPPAPQATLTTTQAPGPSWGEHESLVKSAKLMTTCTECMCLTPGHAGPGVGWVEGC